MRKSLFGIPVCFVLVVVLGMSMSSAASTNKVSLMGAFPPGGSGITGDLLHEYFDEYMAIHPNITIEHFPRTGSDQEAMEQLYTRVAAGDAPDIIYVPQIFLTDYVRAGMVEPVPEPYLSRIEEFFLPGAMYVAQYDGDVYGFPTELMTQSIVYNSVAFAERGMEDRGPDTWEEVREMARKATVHDFDGQIVRAGYGILDYATPLSAFILTYSNSHGYNPIADDLRSVSFSEETSINAVRLLNAMYQEDRTAELVIQPWTGMFFAHGPWQGSGFRSAVGEHFYDGLRSTLPPAGSTGDRQGTFYGYLWAVTPHAKNPEAAFDFLFWLNTELTEWGTTRMGDVLVGGLGSVPTNIPDAMNQSRTEDPFMTGFIDVIVNDQARPIPALPNWLDSFAQLTSRTNQVLRGEMSPEEAMSKVDEHIQQRLDAYFQD